MTDLRSRVEQSAAELRVPGVAVAIHHQGRQELITYGSTAADHGCPIGDDTLFQIGSTAKTFTATMIMVLVDRGLVRLDAPVREYLPELRLADPDAGRTVTVGQLLNHTAGWEGADDWAETGDGSDALQLAVASFGELPQQFAPGSDASYNSAAFVVAGRLVEQVTGEDFGRALAQMILKPLDLRETFSSLNEIMTRPFALGHLAGRSEDPVTVVRPWSGPRGYLPAGARLASSVGDQLTWARFQLGDGRTADGARILAEATLHAMHEPSTPHELMPGVGIGYGWLLRDIGGARLIEHQGDVSGHHSSVTAVPDHDCAIVVLTNSTPNGRELAEKVVADVLESRLGLVDRPSEPRTLQPGEADSYTGSYRTEGVELSIVEEAGTLIIYGTIHDDSGAEDGDSAGDGMGETLAFPIGLYAGDSYRVTGGPFEGMSGKFIRADGAVVAVKHIGRLVPRTQLD